MGDGGLWVWINVFFVRICWYNKNNNWTSTTLNKFRFRGGSLAYLCQYIYLFEYLSTIRCSGMRQNNYDKLGFLNLTGVYTEHDDEVSDGQVS